ncbi:MAG: helix-turn-helix domain-containing protein [Acidimicrobiales bacterium]
MSKSVTRRPAPVLRPFIDGYVGYRIDSAEPGVHRGLPSRHLTFIVSIGDPIDVVAQTDPRQPPDRYRFVAGGLQASAAAIACGRHQEGVAVALTPLGSQALLASPARALWNLSIEAADVIGPPAAELWERVNAAPTWDGRFAACDDVLLRLAGARRSRPPATDDTLAAAWDLLVVTGGGIGVADLAAEVGWSRRHLANRFSGEFGLAPKLAARVVRFERARRLLQRPARLSIATVAATCGYYDQPHLTRDFVELAGCPPGEWLATEFPSVQDDLAPGPAQSGA